MKITLEVVAGPETGRRIWLAADQSLTVGRTQRADFALASDPQMSGVHFEILGRAGAFWVRDRQSTNGTRVNGEVVRECPLKTGDTLQAGLTQFAVVVEEAPSGSHAAKPPLASPAPANLPTTTLSPSATIVVETPPAPATVEAGSDNVAGIADADPPPCCSIDNRTPYAVGFLPWENAEGQGRLTVIVKATWQWDETGVSLAKPPWPIAFADEHEGDDPLQPVRFEADTAPFKPKADVVLVGQVYAPGGKPRPWVDARLRVGGLQRRLRVFGDRRWLFPTRLAVVPQATDPVPFTEMALTYRRAFGGVDGPAGRYCPENLAGVGYIGEPTPASVHDKPLPNIESPDQLITSWDVRPRPAGWGFYGRGWQPRLMAAGTYDDQHRKERKAEFPEDYSYGFHNGAHPDLQVAGYLDGDELIELENVTRDGFARFELPGVRLRITLTRSLPSGERRMERPVKPVLDTLVLVPDERRFYEVFRAVFAVPDLENLDVTEIRIEA